jgi:hypothetical protein
MADYVIGYNWQLGSYFQPGYTQNQETFLATVPAGGTISRIGAWLRAYAGGGGGANVYAKLAVWDAAGAILGQSAGFWVGSSAFAKYERDLSTPIRVSSGQQIYIGVWWSVEGQGDVLLIPIEAGNNFYAKVAGGSGPVTMYDGPGTLYAYRLNTYVIVTPGAIVKVRRGGAWVDAEVKVRRGGQWVDPERIAIRRSGSWHDVE